MESIEQRFTLKHSIGTGAFGDVFLAVRNTDQKEVAIKRLREPFDGWEEAKIQRELLAARDIPLHPNIVCAFEIHYERGPERMNLVFEYMNMGTITDLISDHLDEGKMVDESLIQSFLKGTLRGLQHLHSHKFIHRDLKPENLLLTTHDNGKITCKLADFTLARRVPSGCVNEHNTLRSPATSYIATRWYRAPELLLVDRQHSYPIDIFALGCIMAELYELEPLFPGNSELDQLHMQFEFLGAPTPENWPAGCQLAKRIGGLDLTHASPRGIIHSIGNFSLNTETSPVLSVTTAKTASISTLITPPSRSPTTTSSIRRLSGNTHKPLRNPGTTFDLFQKLVELNPDSRLTAEAALRHGYFQESTPDDFLSKQPSLVDAVHSQPRTRTCSPASIKHKQRQPQSNRDIANGLAKRRRLYELEQEECIVGRNRDLMQSGKIIP